MEEQHGRRKTTKEKISVLIRLFKNNSVLQGHSGRSLIDPSLQDNVIIPDDFFKYIYHVGCAINLHSIINSELIPGGQILRKTGQYSFCLWILWTKNTRILTRSTWKHRVLHGTCTKHGRKHQSTVYWVDINLALKKELKFYQTRSNAIILHETLPACCIPKVVRMETGEIIYEKGKCVTSASSKDFLET